MGKIKQRKYKTRTANPTGLPSVRDIVDEDNELGQGSRVQQSVNDLREMLQGDNVEERDCAAYILANLAKESLSCEMLLDDTIIRTAAPLLLDRNLSVRHAVAGALRNVSAMNHEACSTLVDHDIMTPLVSLFKEYSCEWRPSSSQKVDSKSEIFYEAVHLLWNLCEAAETSVSIFNREGLVDILLPCLDADKYGVKIAVAVAHCLHAVSEDNQELKTAVKELKPFYALCENTSKESSAILLKVLSAGILVNLAEGDEAATPSHLLPAVICVIAEALSIPILDSISRLGRLITDVKGAGKQKNSDTESVDEKENDLVLELSPLLDALAAKQTALEILSNLCYGDDSNESDEEVNESDESGDFEDMEVEETSQVVPLNMPCEAHEAIISSDVVCRVIEHVSPVDEQVVAVLKCNALTAAVPKRVQAVQCRSLQCIANLVQLLEPEDLGGISGLVSTWTCLVQLAFVPKDTLDAELLEASTSACRSVLQALATTVGSTGSLNGSLLSVTEEEVRVMAQVGLQSSEASVRTNIARIMATLGCLLRAESPQLVKKVGQYLLEACLKDTDIVVVTEALDATFDVFGEDSTAAIEMEIELLPKLRQILPAFKAKINQNRKTLGNQYPIVMTAKTNLVRFIQYKSQRGVEKNGKA